MMCKGKLSFILLFLILCNWPNLAQSDNVFFPSNSIDSFTLVLQQRGDEADVYFPDVSAAENAFPIVAVLQGAGVDKSFYSEFGTQLARYGFVVVIPNHLQSFPPGSPPAPLPDQNVILDVLAQMNIEDVDNLSPLFRIVDTSRMGLTGHSFGGAAGLFAIDGSCSPPFCFGPPGLGFPLPDAVRAGAFYGTSSVDPFTGVLSDVDTSAIPVALVQGSLDSITTPAEAQATFEILDGVRAFIDIDGANHYGITDVNNPGGAQPDFSPPSIPQSQSIQEIADAIGQFLNLHVGIELSVSSSSDRSGTMPLEGAILSGNAFIFLTPLFPEGDIDQVDFFLDGSFVKTEFWAPYDLKGTYNSGRSASFDTHTLDDGSHTVRAEIVFPSGIQSVTSTFTTLNNEFSLSVSFSADRTGTIPLEGATLSGNAFIFLTPLFPEGDIDQVDFFLDGSFVKTELWAPYDLKGTYSGGNPAPFDTRTLDNGSHSVRAEIEFDSGEVETVSSAFSVSN